MKTCPCGKIVAFYSALLNQGYCSGSCYEKALEAYRVKVKEEHGNSQATV